MTAPHTAVITGTGVVLPGAHDPASLSGGRPASAEPVDPALLVGRKGLRYKDRATRLAYCAADAALREAGLTTGDGPATADALTVPSASTGVVASSTLGNVDTVVRACEVIRSETVTGTSPMDLPNASSNVIASSVAIRFGLRGPNLMVCNGATGGLDAVRWAVTMLAAGRAERMLVLGVEPDTDEARALLGAPALDGAIALVVETD
ncbi:beta-ketoacyl synthase N-terminal-like domain-containing protein, partial [Saccharomonospora saliphila]|uniref:beta-ketoacyl synthase N-terminal-like domain-containing protein n=1 Tax=Saccharomonospora saliphila TaxID=369829 RepID=UPI000368D035